MNKIISTIFLLTFAVSAFGRGFQPEMPQDLDEVDFYLHTIDLGGLIHEKYGHTQIRVHDRRSGLNVAYSWGIFNYQDPNFALNFYKGIMIYNIGAYSLKTAHRIYQAEGRQVWEDRINLNKVQKQRIMEKIIRDMRPENRAYNYQYFFDNCSTRPRDFLDLALAGSLNTHVYGKPSGRSFRQVVRHYQATTPLTSILLEVTMNSNLDREMTQWEEMFLPGSLRDRLLEMSLVDNAGKETGQGKLLTPVQSFYDKPAPKEPWWRDDLTILAFFALIPLICLVLPRQRDSSAAVRCFGSVLLIWGLLAGLLGILMPLSWGISQHLDLHHNANMFLFWPTDLIYVFVGGKFLWRGRQIQFGPTSRKILRLLALCHIGLAGLQLMLDLLGVFEQSTLRILMSFGISMIILQFGVMTLLNKYGGSKK